MKINEQKLFPYINIAAAYLYLSNYEKSLKYYLTGLELFEKLGKQKEVFDLTIGAGSVYAAMEKYEDALVYYQKALSISTATSNKMGISKSLNNIHSNEVNKDNTHNNANNANNNNVNNVNNVNNNKVNNNNANNIDVNSNIKPESK